jgi:hypothetical protein
LIESDGGWHDPDITPRLSTAEARP